MILFQGEETRELIEEDPDQLDPLSRRFHDAGREKTKEPLHRTKKVRSWPSENHRKTLYLESMVQETGRAPERAALEAYKTKAALRLWERATKEMSEEERQRVLYEHALCHIAKVISNTIHLEKMYTTLKPIGEKQWELASKGLRSLTDEGSLLALTETGKEKITRKIPDWIKGAILYLSLQGSKRGAPNLTTKSEQIPDMNALKSAAEWCLGTHLKIKGHFQTLEETTSIFEGWQIKREKIDLKIVQLKIGEIPEEESVPCPKDINGLDLPWNLAWKILPIMEEEIRELGAKVLTNKAALITLGESYKKQMLDRWLAGVARRNYIRHYEESLGVGDRWRTRTLVLNPIDGYINSKIEQEGDLRFMAKTDAAWILLTEDLPEPEMA